MRECLRGHYAGGAITFSIISKNGQKTSQKIDKNLLQFYKYNVDMNARQRRLICKTKHNCFKA